MIASSRQQGYTLLEVVLALCILAASIAALSESISLSVRRSQRAENLARASLLAASVRDRLGIDIPLGGASQAGNTDDCTWTVAATEARHPGDETGSYPRGFQTHIVTRCGDGAAAREAGLDYFALAGARP